MGMAKAYGRSAGWWLESFNPIENALKPLILHFSPFHQARLAQSVERKALNLVVVIRQLGGRYQKFLGLLPSFFW